MYKEPSKHLQTTLSRVKRAVLLVNKAFLTCENSLITCEKGLSQAFRAIGFFCRISSTGLFCRIYRSLLQNIVSFIGLFCKRDL